VLDPERTGLDIVMTCGATPSTQILEVDGGGLGLIDYDGDGDLDVFVANGATMDDPEHGPGSRLYENQGGLRFRDVTAEVGISLRRWAMGVAVGDYDGDGWEDIYVTCYGPNVLLRNEGGRFADVTDLAGVGDPRWATSSAFGDLDGDGDLDLYVVNYLRFDIADPPRLSRFKGVQVMGGPHGLPTQHDVLYENLGDGTFRDVTSAAGCLPARAGYGLGVVILDFDGDGRQDSAGSPPTPMAASRPPWASPSPTSTATAMRTCSPRTSPATRTRCSSISTAGSSTTAPCSTAWA
jgi:hypothetical protein